MNIRKIIDYSEMYTALDTAMAAELSQVELYSAIGKTVSARSEKGAAVAAAEYLRSHYPDVSGFSPRNLRRMRDFYRTYENHPAMLSLAMQIGWTQNVVILEADLTMELREWYLKATKQFEWSKAELTEKIVANAHEEIVLAIEEEAHYIAEKENESAYGGDHKAVRIINKIRQMILRYGYRLPPKKGGRRRWPIMLCLIPMVKWIAIMRCWRPIPFGGHAVYYERKWLTICFKRSDLIQVGYGKTENVRCSPQLQRTACSRPTIYFYVSCNVSTLSWIKLRIGCLAVVCIILMIWSGE